MAGISRRAIRRQDAIPVAPDGNDSNVDEKKGETADAPPYVITAPSASSHEALAKVSGEEGDLIASMAVTHRQKVAKRVSLLRYGSTALSAEKVASAPAPSRQDIERWKSMRDVLLKMDKEKKNNPETAGYGTVASSISGTFWNDKLSLVPLTMCKLAYSRCDSRCFSTLIENEFAELIFKENSKDGTYCLMEDFQKGMNMAYADPAGMAREYSDRIDAAKHSNFKTGLRNLFKKKSAFEAGSITPCATVASDLQLATVSKSVPGTSSEKLQEKSEAATAAYKEYLKGYLDRCETYKNGSLNPGSFRSIINAQLMYLNEIECMAREIECHDLECMAKLISAADQTSERDKIAGRIFDSEKMNLMASVRGCAFSVYALMEENSDLSQEEAREIVRQSASLATEYFNVLDYAVEKNIVDRQKVLDAFIKIPYNGQSWLLNVADRWPLHNADFFTAFAELLGTVALPSNHQAVHDALFGRIKNGVSFYDIIVGKEGKEGNVAIEFIFLLDGWGIAPHVHAEKMRKLLLSNPNVPETKTLEVRAIKARVQSPTFFASRRKSANMFRKHFLLGEGDATNTWIEYFGRILLNTGFMINVRPIKSQIVGIMAGAISNFADGAAGVDDKSSADLKRKVNVECGFISAVMEKAALEAAKNIVGRRRVTEWPNKMTEGKEIPKIALGILNEYINWAELSKKAKEVAALQRKKEGKIAEFTATRIISESNARAVSDATYNKKNRRSSSHSGGSGDRKNRSSSAGLGDGQQQTTSTTTAKHSSGNGGTVATSPAPTTQQQRESSSTPHDASHTTPGARPFDPKTGQFG